MTMKTTVIDILDFERINTLLEGFNKSTGFVTAILDLEGNVLSKSGWRHICTDFHRVNPQTSKKCTISDTVLAGKMASGEKYHFYKCLNGLVDVAVPLVINGEHIANLFSGQFFFENPDRDFFINQAKKHGFNNKKYLIALDEVPVFSEDKVKPAMDFLLNMTGLIVEMTIQRLEQIQLNKALKESEEKYRSIFENSSIAILLTAPDGTIFSANNFACQIFGWTEQEICETGRSGLIDITDPRLPKHLKERKSTGKTNGELTFIKKDGTRFECEVSSVIFLDMDGNERTSMIIRELTEQKKSEEKILNQLNELQRWHTAMLDREERTLELKREVNKLLVADGKPFRYASAENKAPDVEQTRHPEV